MQLWSVLGQYLLLSFVLPGFCYLTAFYLCFPGVLGRVFPGVLGEIGPGGRLRAEGELPAKDGKPKCKKEGGKEEGGKEEGGKEEGGKEEGIKAEASEEEDSENEDRKEQNGKDEDGNEEHGSKADSKKEASQGFWITLIAGILGLALSSVSFAIEAALRKASFFDCYLFTRVPFDKLATENPLANFLAAETFMHFNIAIGLLIILVLWIANRKTPVRREDYLCDPRQLTGGLIVVIIANLIVSSHLFGRVAVAAYRDVSVAKAAVRVCQNSDEHPWDIIWFFGKLRP